MCYVYQNRYVASDIDENFQTYWRIYDFDQLRTRKIINERRNADSIKPFTIPERRAVWEPLAGDGPSRWRPGRRYEYDAEWPQDGARDGIYLHQKETVIKQEEPLMSEIRTGSEFPYLCTEKNVLDFGSSAHERSMMLDDQRIILVKVSYSKAAKGDND